MIAAPRGAQLGPSPIFVLLRNRGYVPVLVQKPIKLAKGGLFQEVLNAVKALLILLGV